MTIRVKVNDSLASSADSLLGRLILRQLHAANKMRLLWLIFFIELHLHRGRPYARSVSGSQLDRILCIHPFGRTVGAQKYGRSSCPAMLISPWCGGRITWFQQMNLGCSPIVDGMGGMHHCGAVLHFCRQHHLRLQNEMTLFRIVFCTQCLTCGLRKLKIHFTAARRLAGLLIEDQPMCGDVNDLRFRIICRSRMR